MLIYPTFKMAPIQGLVGLGGGATGELVRGGRTLVTETLQLSSSSSQNWTAPAGVTSVDAVLTGADDIPQKFVSINMKAQAYYTGTAPSTSSMTAAIQSWLNSHASYINSGAPNQRTLVGPRQNSFTLNTGETVTVYESNHIYGPTRTATVTQTMSTSFSSVTHNVGGKHFFRSFGGLKELEPGIAGGNTTIFGYTAAGAPVGGSPSTVTQTNISVTPGQNYSYNTGFINSYAGGYTSRTGSIVLTYFA